jgi:hypothetical protein
MAPFDLLLNDLWYGTAVGEESAAFANARVLYNIARKRDPTIQLADVQSWLKKQPTYIRFKQPNKRLVPRGKSARTFLVSAPGVQLTGDCMYLSKGRFRFVVVFVDMFSGFTHVEFVTSLKSAVVARALQKCIEANPFLERCRRFFSDR